jgi:hypothetical protein
MRAPSRAVIARSFAGLVEIFILANTAGVVGFEALRLLDTMDLMVRVRGR